MAVWVIREPGNGIALRFEAPLDVEGRERISNVLQQANDPCDGIDLISPTRKELIGEDVIALKGRFRCKQQLKKALDQDLRFHLFLFAYHLLSMSSPTSVSLSGGKICFNSHCNEVIPDHTPPRKKGGWRLRSGEIAELCDRCSCARVFFRFPIAALLSKGLSARRFTLMLLVGGTVRRVASLQSDLQQRLSYEFDRPGNIEKLAPGGRLSISAHEKKFEELPERIMSGGHNNIVQDRYAHGSTENDPDSIRKSVIPDPCSTSSGVKIEAKANSSIKLQPLPISKEDSSPLIGLAAPFSSTNGSREPMKFLSNQPPQLATSPIPKQFYPEGIADAELQIQMRNGRARMLSASDAGRIGRLVLPKKCAEVTS
ncbi:hypothetical protein B296_00027197 [Ensete ventricosum]|uniref:Uncharacterized protein n=1 Tax=Ensete ventricosum TaxID=4639 RepID=A0A426YMP0_ENSVE|nr:hypothetical protein B296_00027197 [Ensete ventricosum]